MSNWNWVQIKDIGEIVTGNTPSTKKPSNYGDYLPFVKPPQLNSNIIADAPQALSKKGAEKARVLPPNSVMVSCIGNLGMVALNRCQMATNQQINSIIPNGDVDSKFLFYQIQSPHFLNQLDELSSATTVTIVNKGNFSKAEIHLPPIDIQHRIVEKIEELYSDLDNGIENLKKAKQQLETYKQAVLKSAFEGKLTKQWREQQDLPTPEELKKQIKVERNRYREQQLEEWRQEVEDWKEAGEPGKKPRKPMKGRKFDPLDEELEDLPKLPRQWDWIRISDTVSRVEYGTSQKSEDTGKVPVLRMGNMQDGKFVWDDLVYSNDSEEIEKYLLQPGDVLFNRTNSPELVGKTALYKGQRKAIFAGYLIRLNQIDTIVDARYLTYYLNSYEAQNYGNKVKTDGVNQSNINGTKLSSYPLPYTSLQEQKKIADMIDSRLSTVEQTQKTIQQELQKAKALRQSILKKAFEGNLVEV